MISTKASDKVPELENDVLSGTRFQIIQVFLKCTHVVWSQESHRKSDLSMLLELLDYRPPPIRLLVQNDRIERQLTKESGNCLLGFVISSVNNEYLIRTHWLISWSKIRCFSMIFIFPVSFYFISH